MMVLLAGTRRWRAFTLIELMVAVGIVGLLMSILVPTVSRAREAAQRVVCASNMRQLTLGWMIYANDNKGRLVSSHPYSPGWVMPGNTEEAITQGLLYPYLNAVKVYHCPTDADGSRWVTYSMNDYLNPGNEVNQARYFGIRRITQILQPAETIVFIEENDPRGYNMGGFYEIYPLERGPGQWVDVPAKWHRNGCNLSFADGHVGWWQWVDPRTVALSDMFENQANNPDLEKLKTSMVTWPQTQR